MKHIFKRCLPLLIVLAVVIANQAAYAEPLLYRGDNKQQAQDPTVQDAQSPALPVLYGTNYDPQFAPYASFMQAPGYSQGPLQRQYGGAPGNSSMVNPAMPARQNQMDPYAASEVSPYSRYSPYIEVIGEGSDYTLGIDDVVTIIVRNQPDFSGRFVVDPEGNIQYNFVGDIPAVGKTKEELKAEIMKRLTRFVRYPEVAVMISEYRSKAVYVFGFVNSFSCKKLPQ